jgi:hypothetical protein
VPIADILRGALGTIFNMRRYGCGHIRVQLGAIAMWTTLFTVALVIAAALSVYAIAMDTVPPDV